MGVYRASKGVARLPNPAPEGHLNTDDACARLKVTLNRLRDLKEQGQLRGIKRKEGLTIRLYIETASIDEYLQRRHST